MITITRQLGSGGTCIGKLVARRLGYAYVDRQILEQAARELGVTEAEIEDREEHIQSFGEKLMWSFTMAGHYRMYTPRPLWIQDEDLAKVERLIITELALKGPCVILGRGAFHLLRGRVPLLNIMVHAPLKFRVERVMSVYKAKSKSEAIQMIERSDRDRGRYIKTFTGLDWSDTRNYDLTLNTGKIDFNMAEEMIVSLARCLPADDKWPLMNKPSKELKANKGSISRSQLELA